MRYLLELTIRKDNPSELDFVSYDKIEGDSLTQVLSQLPLVIASYCKKNEDELTTTHNSYICSKCGEDDIPF